jgi:hypothetical protein
LPAHQLLAVFVALLETYIVPKFPISIKNARIAARAVIARAEIFRDYPPLLFDDHGRVGKVNANYFASLVFRRSLP